MKRILISFFSFVAMIGQALEYEVQFENSQICIAKVKIEGREEIGSHRDTFPYVVVALKGGTLTRVEVNGKRTDVHFPTGISVVREADPENSLYKIVNSSDEAIELMTIQLKNSPPPIKNRSEKTHDISLTLQLNCPQSLELQNYLKSIPPPQTTSTNYNEWKTSFVGNMKELIHLVESENIYSSWWSVHTNERPALPNTK